MTTHDYSRLFATIPTIRNIRYSGFPDTPDVAVFLVFGLLLQRATDFHLGFGWISNLMPVNLAIFYWQVNL